MKIIPLPLFAVFACATVLVQPVTLPASDAKPVVGLKLVVEGFTTPIDLTPLPDGSGRLLIVDQAGTISVLKKDGTLADELFADVRPKLTKLNTGFDERGLLGVALHPKCAQNRKFYAYYSAPRRAGLDTNWNHTSHLSEFTAAPDFSRLDLATEKVLLQIDEPQFNHNGGRILFGPDGYLYLGVGDGGGANDNEFGHPDPGNGQNTTTLLGKILRIDVDKGEPYSVPADNPFADGREGRKEIFAWGFRNPWGLSFDRGGTREFFVADVGQNLYEELNIVVKGGNYGWRLREGFHGFNPKEPNKSPEDAPTKDAAGRPFMDPILEYKHPGRGRIDPAVLQGISVTGGYVYRGKAIPSLAGRYVFGDWSRSWALPDGVFFTASRAGQGRDAKWTLESLAIGELAGGKFGGYLIAFAEDADGELYVLANGRNTLAGKTGKVYKLVPL